MPEAKWYIVHTYPSHENKVKASIEKIAASRNMQDVILEVRVPTGQVVEQKDGKKKIKDVNLFPSYAMVKMVMTDESWYVVRNTKGVTGFVGSASEPVPLSDTEVYSMGLEVKAFETDIEIGENVRVISGPFDTFIGEVLEIDEHNQTLKVKINMFGRDTPVEIAYNQVTKL
ncbi:MAG: transcription termination/antitermination protein NusG [Bacillota bacterium]|nr:transcription termination/antitermination protein NusG [Bacillota bacterium]